MTRREVLAVLVGAPVAAALLLTPAPRSYVYGKWRITHDVAQRTWRATKGDGSSINCVYNGQEWTSAEAHASLHRVLDHS